MILVLVWLAIKSIHPFENRVCAAYASSTFLILSFCMACLHGTKYFYVHKKVPHTQHTGIKWVIPKEKERNKSWKKRGRFTGKYSIIYKQWFKIISLSHSGKVWGGTRVMCRWWWMSSQFTNLALFGFTIIKKDVTDFPPAHILRYICSFFELFQVFPTSCNSWRLFTQPKPSPIKCKSSLTIQLKNDVMLRH